METAMQGTNKLGELTCQHNSNPVRCIDGDWGFYEEDWATWHGGYNSEAEANEAIAAYCRDVLGA
jgi:hypothetical protein